MSLLNSSARGVPANGIGRSMAESAAGPTNTLRLNAATLTRLIAEMEVGSSAHNSARSLVRWPFLKLAVTVAIHQGAGNSTRLQLACRNLSGEGVGLLHSSFLHTGTRCTVYLPQLVGAVVPVDGKVVRCRHVRGLVHELGIAFDKPINIRQFVSRDPTRGLFTLEHVDPTRLQGVVLHIDDSAMRRKLVRHYLRDTSLEIVNAETGQEGLDRASDGFDLILADYDLHGIPGPSLVAAIRAKGLQTSIVMLTVNSRLAFNSDGDESRANAYLQLPINEEQLLRGVAEFLLADGSNADAGGPVFSTLPGGHPSNQFVVEFVEEARRLANGLLLAMSGDDVVGVRRMCNEVKNVSSEVGFGMIAESAQAAVTALDASMSVADAQRQLRSLASMCMRVKTR